MTAVPITYEDPKRLDEVSEPPQAPIPPETQVRGRRAFDPEGPLSDMEPSAAYVLPAGLPPGPLLPPESNPEIPVVVPIAGLPPVPAVPPGFIPETPVFEPAAGKFPDGTLAAAPGAAGAGDGGGVEVVGAGGGGGGSAGAGAAGASAAAAIVTAATARDAPAADAMVVLRMISTRFMLFCCDVCAARVRLWPLRRCRLGCPVGALAFPAESRVNTPQCAQD
jgi:hypothetical protein